jgi:hypothetical protein
MLLRYERMGIREVDGPLGLEVVRYGYVLENSTEVRRGSTYEQVESGRG